MGGGPEPEEISKIDIIRSPSALMAAISGGALAVSALLKPSKVTELSLCPVFHLTGFECPFCGMTRSFVSITHGRFSESLDYNPGSLLIYGAFVWMLYISVRDLIQGQFKEIPYTPKWMYKVWITLTIPIFAWLFWSRLVSGLF